MLHKCKVTVLRKECYTDLQEKYLLNPKSGACPFYEVGQEFWFDRYIGKDDFWHMGQGNHCAEAWDCISRYIYSALQGGSVMRKWTNDDRMMIACCNDGTRPVIFKIERVDYKAVYVEKLVEDKCKEEILQALRDLDGITEVKFDENREGNFAEVWLSRDVEDAMICDVIESSGKYQVLKID